MKSRQMTRPQHKEAANLTNAKIKLKRDKNEIKTVENMTIFAIFPQEIQTDTKFCILKTNLKLS